MGISRSQKFRLGVFVLLGLGVFLGGLAILAGLKLGEKREAYSVRFSQMNVSLSGLEVGSPVKYSGLRVGRVERVGVARDDVGIIVVELTLNEGTPVAEDSKANLGSMGITGLKYIELTRGSKGARLREPGEVIPEGTSLIDDLSGQAGDIARKVQETLDNVNALTGPDNRAQIRSILERTERTLAQLEGAVTENREGVRVLVQRVGGTAEQIEALTTQLNGTLGRVDRILSDARPRLNTTFDRTNALIGELRTTRAKLDETLAATTALATTGEKTLGPEGVGALVSGLNEMQKQALLLLRQTRERVVDAVGYLKEASENMAIFSEKIRDDPSLLLLGEGENE